LKILKFLIIWIVIPFLLIYVGFKTLDIKQPIIVGWVIYSIVLYIIFFIKFQKKWKKEKEEQRKEQLKNQIQNEIIKKIKIKDKFGDKDYLILTDKNEFFILKENNDNSLKAFEIKNYDYNIKHFTKEIDRNFFQIPEGYSVSNEELYQWKFYLKNGNKLIYNLNYETHNKLEQLFLENFSKNI